MAVKAEIEPATGALEPRSISPAQRQQRQLAAVKTGLYVKAPAGLRLRSRRVRRLVSKMRAVMPWLDDSDLPACRAWAEFEILGATAFADLIERGMTNDNGDPRRLLGEFRQLRQAQLGYERGLGMTPAARMSLRVGDSRARSFDRGGVAASAEDVAALETRVLARLGPQGTAAEVNSGD